MQHIFLANPHSRYNKWPAEGVEMSDLKENLVLLLNMGLVPKTKKMDFWSNSCPIATPYFNEVMPSNVWALIDCMPHVNDITREVPRGQDGFDPWIKVRAVLDKVNKSVMIWMKNRVIYI